MHSPLATPSSPQNVFSYAQSTSIPSRVSCRKPYRASLMTSIAIAFTIVLSVLPAAADAHPVISNVLVQPTPITLSPIQQQLAILHEQNIIITDSSPSPTAAPKALVKRKTSTVITEILPPDEEDVVTVVQTITGSRTKSASSSSVINMPSALPSPFDSNLGSNYTSQTCPEFINSFLNAPEFKACLPFSLLLESSRSFFDTTKSNYLTTRLLDTTCAANVTACTSYLTGLSEKLVTKEACKSDYDRRQPIVNLIQRGLVAYQPLYSASCLKSPTGSYCFADAITNTSSPTDSYVYFLGLGESLPAGASMSCNSCLQKTMNIWAAASQKEGQPVRNVYEGGARVVNSLCGPAWVNATLPQVAFNEAGRSKGSGRAGFVVGIAALMMLL